MAEKQVKEIFPEKRVKPSSGPEEILIGNPMPLGSLAGFEDPTPASDTFLLCTLAVVRRPLLPFLARKVKHGSPPSHKQQKG